MLPYILRHISTNSSRPVQQLVKLLLPCPGCLKNSHAKKSNIYPLWRYLSTTEDKENGKGQATTDVDTVVKVIAKPKQNRQKIDYNKTYTDNIYVTPTRAMQEYLLSFSDLDKLTKFKRRSPFPDSHMDHIFVYKRQDVIQRAHEVWGSATKLELEQKKRKVEELNENIGIFLRKSAIKQYRKDHSNKEHEQPYIFSDRVKEPKPETLFSTGSGRVVLYAIAINSANFTVKMLAWLYTGSHSMFSEMIHSFADTVNQMILAFGIHMSLKRPDNEHPYGWANFRYISSLISGVGIFFLGGGISCYHGLIGVLHPQPLDSLFWAIAILGGSFISEGASFLVAYNEVKTSAEKAGMKFMEYVHRGFDPSVNVVLLEDFAAVLGVSVAAICMTISHYTGTPWADATGSLIIGTLLGAVASFVIHTNTTALIGKSIPTERQQVLRTELESDRMIRALHDVKATEMGGRMVKFKAEVDFDGKEVARSYLDQQNLEVLLEHAQGIKSVDELEEFMLRHGEGMVNLLGAEIDRIERNLKKKHPEVRHVDLEAL